MVFLGFFLVIPPAYNQLDVQDLGAVGNSTLDDAYGFSLSMQNISGVLIIVAAVFALVIVMIWIVGRRG